MGAFELQKSLFANVMYEVVLAKFNSERLKLNKLLKSALISTVGDSIASSNIYANGSIPQKLMLSVTSSALTTTLTSTLIDKNNSKLFRRIILAASSASLKQYAKIKEFSIPVQHAMANLPQAFTGINRDLFLNVLENVVRDGMERFGTELGCKFAEDMERYRQNKLNNANGQNSSAVQTTDIQLDALNQRLLDMFGVDNFELIVSPQYYVTHT